MKVSWGRVVLGVVAVLVLAKVLGHTTARTSVAPVAQAAQPEPSEQLPKVSAGALLGAYKANEAAFDQKYKGKRVQVTGPIVAIKTDLSGDPQIWLASQLEPVVLNGHSKDWAATLKIGQSLTDKCEVTAGLMGLISLDCSR